MANSTVVKFFEKWIKFADQFNMEPDAELPETIVTNSDQNLVETFNFRNGNFVAATTSNGDHRHFENQDTNGPQTIYTSTPVNNNGSGESSSISEGVEMLWNAENYCLAQATDEDEFSSIINTQQRFERGNLVVSSIETNELGKFPDCEESTGFASTNASSSVSSSTNFDRLNDNTGDSEEPYDTDDQNSDIDEEPQPLEDGPSLPSTSGSTESVVKRKQTKRKVKDTVFEDVIQRISSNVSSDLELSSDAAKSVDAILLNVFENIAKKAGKITASKKRKTLSVDDLILAIDLSVPPSIAEQAIRNAEEQMQLYKNYVNRFGKQML